MTAKHQTSQSRGNNGVPSLRWILGIDCVGDDSHGDIDPALHALLQHTVRDLFAKRCRIGRLSAEAVERPPFENCQQLAASRIAHVYGRRRDLLSSQENA